MDKKIRKDYYIIVCVSFVFYFCLVWIVKRGTSGDDVNFVTSSYEYSLIEWVKMRYLTWSGRIVSEIFIWIFAHVPIFFWKIYTLTCCILMSVYMYKYAILFGNKRSIPLIVVCVLSPFLMNAGAFVDGSLWVTGAMNYLWVAVPGVIGMYYIAEEWYMEMHSVRLLKRIIVACMLFLTISSSEQMGAVIVTLLGLLNGWNFYKKRTDLYNISVFFACLLIYLAVTIFCPGVMQRRATAIENRIPDFLTVNLYFKLEYSIRWILNSLVNRMGFLLPLVWGGEILLLLKKEQKRDFEWFLIFTITFAEIITIFKDRLPALFEFSAEWGITVFGIFSQMLVLMWLGLLFASIVALPFCFHNIYRGIMAVLLLLASYASTAIIVFTATRYASGCRIMYNPSLIIIILILFMLSEMRTESEDLKCQLKPYSLAYSGIMVCSLYAYASLIMIFSSGFFIHLS